MAVYSGFNDYLSIDGVVINRIGNAINLVRDVELTRSMETADTTGGAGATHRSRNAALKDTELSFTVLDIDDAATWAILQPLLKEGEHTVIYGSQGNGSGKPKHEQKFIFTENAFSGNYEQTDARTFPVTGIASAPPVTDIFDGGTF